MADIFISYSRLNASEADALRRLLENESISSWIDRTGIYGTDEWPEEIVKAIGECSILILLISHFSVVSHMVIREVMVAIQDGKKIFPIYLEDIELKGSLKYLLAGIQHHSFAQQDEILKSINRVLHPTINRPTAIPYLGTPRPSLSPTSKFEKYKKMGIEDRISGTRDQHLLESWNDDDHDSRVKSRGYINGFFEPTFADGDFDAFYEIDIEGNGASAVICKTFPDRQRIDYVVIAYKPDEGASPQAIDGEGTYHFYDLQIRGEFFGNGFTNRARLLLRKPVNIKIKASGLEDACDKFFERYEAGEWRLLSNRFYNFIFENLP